jgi:hypothetical protein
LKDGTGLALRVGRAVELVFEKIAPADHRHDLSRFSGASRTSAAFKLPFRLFGKYLSSFSSV